MNIVKRNFVARTAAGAAGAIALSLVLAAGAARRRTKSTP